MPCGREGWSSVELNISRDMRIERSIRGSIYSSIKIIVVDDEGAAFPVSNVLTWLRTLKD
jgi:hypothetical protein